MKTVPSSGYIIWNCTFLSSCLFDWLVRASLLKVHLFLTYFHTIQFLKYINLINNFSSELMNKTNVYWLFKKIIYCLTIILIKFNKFCNSIKQNIIFERRVIISCLFEVHWGRIRWFPPEGKCGGINSPERNTIFVVVMWIVRASVTCKFVTNID